MTLGVITILLTLFGWTSIPLFLRSFRHDIDPWTANGWRYGFSALVWAIPLVVLWKRRKLPAGLWRAALWPSIWNVVAQICFGIAPYYVDPGLMTFSLRVNVVVLTFGSALLFPAERRIIRRPGFILGIAMVVGGAAATIFLEPEGLGGGTGIGVGLAVASGIFYAFYALAVRRSMVNMPSLVAFAAVNQLTAAGLVACMLCFGHDVTTKAWNGGAGVLALPPWFIVKLLLSALIGIGLGHTFYFVSISRLGLAVSSAVVQLQPVTVSLAAMVLFDEGLTRRQWAFGLLAIAGAGVILLTQARQSRADALAARAAAAPGLSGEPA